MCGTIILCHRTKTPAARTGPLRQCRHAQAPGKARAARHHAIIRAGECDMEPKPADNDTGHRRENPGAAAGRELTAPQGSSKLAPRRSRQAHHHRSRGAGSLFFFFFFLSSPSQNCSFLKRSSVLQVAVAAARAGRAADGHPGAAMHSCHGHRAPRAPCLPRALMAAANISPLLLYF